MLGQPVLVAGHDRGDAQGEALLAQEGVAAITRSVRPDLTGFGEMDDVLVVGVTGPGRVDVALGQWRSDRMEARDEIAVVPSTSSAPCPIRVMMRMDTAT